MTCESKYSTASYSGGDAPDVTIGCVPTGDGEPTEAPATDQLPFYYDLTAQTLYYYDGIQWHSIDQLIGDLDPVDIDVVNNLCENLNIPVTYDSNGCVVEGTITLDRLSQAIDDCLGLTDALDKLQAQVDAQVDALDKLQAQVDATEDANPIVNISTGADGKVIATHLDGTKETLQIDTDQVVSVSANGQAITFTNEDGSTFTVTGTMIKTLIASEYVDTTELETALDAIDLDQVTKFSVNGSNLVITNEDGSTASISRDALVNFLNQGLVTDEELANAIANIKPVKVAAGNNTTVTSSTTNGTTTYTVNSLGYELDTSGQKLRLVNSNGKVVSTVSHTELRQALGVTEVFDVTGKTRFAALEV